ncbi:MAG: hypothetical protein K2M79_05780 [Muribaculaceae bacterium]|nr:hypothetical protein [Muribaculaceae bacterium]
MRKLYSLFGAAALAFASFTASADATVTIYSSNYLYLKVYEGTDNTGTPVPLTSYSTEVTISGDELYMETSNSGWGDPYYFTAVRITPDNDEDQDKTTIKLAREKESCTMTGVVDGYINVQLNQGRKVTVNVDDPELIKVGTSSYNASNADLVEGPNTIVIGTYDGFYMAAATDEWLLTKATRTPAGGEPQDLTISKFTSVNVYSYQVSNGDVYDYELTHIDDLEIPEFQIRVDNPEKVSVQVDYNSKTLEPNTWTTFQALDGTARVTVRFTGDGYQVTNNGVPVTPSYGSYEITAKGGDMIDVQYNFPEVYSTVSVSFADPAGAAGLTAIKYLDEDVDFSEPFQVQNGRKIQYYVNTDDFKFNSVTANGEDITPGYFYKYEDLQINEDTELVFDLEPYPVMTATIKCENFDGLVLKKDDTEIEVTGEETVVTFTEKSRTYSVGPRSGYVFHSAVISGENRDEEFEIGPNSAYALADGDVVTVDITKLDRSNTLVLYLDDIEYFNSSWYYDFNFVTALGEELAGTFKNGYNFIKFDNAEVPLKKVYFYPSSYKTVLLNGEPLEGGSEGSWGGMTYNNVEIADGDVLKMYVRSTPQIKTLTVNADDDAEFVVEQDYATVVDHSMPIEAHNGTHLHIVPTNAEAPVKVYLQGAAQTLAEGDEENLGTELTADENGKFLIELNDHASVVVKKDDSSSISSVVVDGTAVNSDVYTVDGVLVMRNASAKDVEALPAGFYIVGTQKIIKK